MPFAAVSEALGRLAGVTLPTTTGWEQTQRRGEQLRLAVEKQRQRVSLERTRWEDRRYQPRASKSIALDGGMVNIRGEGWKEIKVGVVGDIAHDRQRASKTVRVQAMRYTAVLGDVARFAPAMWALAVETNVPYAGRSAVTSDGASWVWRLSADLFPVSVQIVDWYHARQHLAHAAQVRYPTQAEQATWYDQMTTALFRGEIWKIVSDLCAHHLADLAAYFRTHQRRMQYQEFREEGYPIGSGTIESGVKQFKQRLTAAGMRWSRLGAERLLTVRAAVLSHSFDALWSATF